MQALVSGRVGGSWPQSITAVLSCCPQTMLLQAPSATPRQVVLVERSALTWEQLLFPLCSQNQ